MTVSSPGCDARTGVALAQDIDTPYLLVDPAKLARNISRLQDQLAVLGTGLRPHLKIAKSLEVAALLFNGGRGPITVSTLLEAEVFAQAGYTDILYAVGLALHRIERVIALHERGG